MITSNVSDRITQLLIDDVTGRWSLVDVDPDLMDLSDTAPFKGRDVLAFRSKRR